MRRPGVPKPHGEPLVSATKNDELEYHPSPFEKFALFRRFILLNNMYLKKGLGTPLLKVQQVLLWLPATIPAPYELPGSGLSENIKIKKIYRGTLTSELSKTSFLLRFT